MSGLTKLTIAACDHLQRGVHKGAISGGVIELVFYSDNNIIKRASLSADRTSLYRSVEATKDKITLFCKRLGIDESQLEYDRSNLSKKEKLLFKLRFLKKMFFEAFIPTQWIIVYKHKDDPKWKRIIPDSRVFQADTFVIYKDGIYTIFYEELKFADYHGYLMAAELDIENNQLINEKIILKLNHHLSYPNIFKENDTYYMIPEAGDSGRVDLYQCTSFPYEWTFKQTLINNIEAVDTTPLRYNNAWYLFTTVIEKGADCNDELSIFKSDDIFNMPFEPLYNEPVISDICNARMGGNFFEKDGELFRVSQNCGKRYGYQANLNKVIQIEGGYKEERVEIIKPSFGSLGFHTYNQAHELMVGDMEIARFDFYSLKRFVWGNFKSVVLGKS